MPRHARIESETKHYHVMTRGINKDKIFSGESDKKKLMELLRSKLEDVDITCVGYCIMDNHLHLALVGEIEELRSFMKKVNISYAMYYNRKHNRIGPVFQDRFKSENIFNESHLMGVIRYIHNNPVNAGMVKTPEEYKWSSMNEYITKELFLIGVETKENVLGGFNSKDGFMEFHKQNDDREYLETKEEERKHQDKKIRKIIESYFKDKGMVEENQIKDLDSLIVLLIERGLSYRKVAKLTNTSVHRVYIANKKNRP
ncbi:transposase [Gudongella sp. SC589]|uniref:transposase n=1 Tax=Gudongella sp. SC589 TaxID=3385990 RepID=UPI003904AAB1